MIKFYYNKSSHVKADNFSQSVSALKTKMISTYMAKSFIVPGFDSLIHLQGENITFSVLLDKDCYKEHTFACIIILPCTHILQHACRLLNRSLPNAVFFPYHCRLIWISKQTIRLTGFSLKIAFANLAALSTAAYL